MKNIFFLLVVSFSFQSCRQSVSQESGVPNPNIILIMTDDLGWGDTGFNGNTRVNTASLDALAARGVVLERFYSASAVCSPTRASCLTGRNPFRIGIPTANAGHMKKEEITLPELLKDAGYTSAHFGKWHLGTLTTKIKDANRGRPGDSAHYSPPSMHGYDEYFVTESKTPTFDPMIKPQSFDTLKGENLRYGWAAITDDEPRETYGTYYWEGSEQSVSEGLEGDDSEIIVDRAIPFIEKAVKNQQAFFTAIWFHTPHLPVVADQVHRDAYADLTHREQIYYGTITNMDEQVGRLWTKLEELGVAENTMLWFCSDNGPERQTPGSAGPFRERKRSLYEGGVRVPAFLLYPAKIKGGQKSAVPFVTSDYLPTILDFLNLPYPDERPLDGRSMKDILLEEKTTRDHPIGFLYRQKASWVTDPYKLISTDDRQTFELYDLLADPEEKNNIAAQNPDRVREMKTALLEWATSCKRSEEGMDY